jgi:FMN reductase
VRLLTGPGHGARRRIVHEPPPTELNGRIERAAFELALLVESGFARKIRTQSWRRYQPDHGSAGGTETAIDLDTDLMRLAAGGSAT